MNLLHVISMLVASCLIFASTAFANLVTNGDFETTSNLQGKVNSLYLNNLSSGQWDVFTSLPGWTTTTGYGIEVQHNAVASGTGLYVELDSHPWSGSSSSTTNSNISQNIAGLTVGQQYTIQFDYYSRTGTPSSGINVSLGDFSYDVLSTAKSWTTILQTFVYSGSNSNLTFLATGSADQLGGFIDNVSLSAVPVPAAAWMLGAGVLAIAGIRRKLV